MEELFVKWLLFKYSCGNPEIDCQKTGTQTDSWKG